LLLQAYDFLQLFEHRHCSLQVGGSDQWGNITAGTELIKRTRDTKAHGLVFPLLTTATGQKFGKTEAGTVWLDRNLTGWHQFYQFWLNTDDRDVVKYLKFFTFLDSSRISELEATTRREPESRHAQRELARQVTLLVHGEDAVREAEAAAQKLFGGDISSMSVEELLQVFPNVPSKTIPFQPDGWRLTSLLTEVGLTKSNSEATKLIRGRGIYVNGRQVTDEWERLSPQQAIERQLFVVRKGKRDNFLIRIVRG
jgi:tyrosyl-tRNA synthetase